MTRSRWHPALPILLALALSGALLAACGSDEAGFAGTFTETSPGAGGPIDRTLVLEDDGAARFEQFYVNADDTIVETGTWTEADGRAEVTLTSKDGEARPDPVVIVFELDDDTLTATDYDLSLFGSAGLHLTRE